MQVCGRYQSSPSPLAVTVGKALFLSESPVSGEIEYAEEKAYSYSPLLDSTIVKSGQS